LSREDKGKATATEAAGKKKAPAPGRSRETPLVIREPDEEGEREKKRKKAAATGSQQDEAPAVEPEGDTFAGMAKAVSANIPDSVRRTASQMGGKYYSNIVRTVRLSGSSISSPSHKDAIVLPISDPSGGPTEEEAESMPPGPPLPVLSGKEKLHVVRELVKAAPKELAHSLKGFSEGHISPIQYALIEVWFCT